jgi:hypothetical protein
VEEKPREAGNLHAANPAGADRLLRDTLLQVHDHPDISERSRRELLDRLIAGWRKLAEAEKKAAEDRIWMLNFRFGKPRLMTTEVPGTGGKTVTVWYWRYDVANPTDRSHRFVPGFEIVTPGKVYHDGVWAGMTEAVRRVEDPARFLELKNSVTIAAEPIPAAQGVVSPNQVAGVAVWGYAEPEASDARSCTIFVSGLTNAWSITSSPEGDTPRRKVLKVSFKRVGQEMVPTGPAEWVYRSYPVEKAPSSEKPRAEIEGLIRQLTQHIADLEREQQDWKKARQVVRDRLEERRCVLDNKLGDDRTAKDRAAMLEMANRIRELMEQIDSGDRKETTRRAAREALEPSLGELRRLLRTLPEQPSRDPRTEAEKRKSEIEKLRSTIAGLQQQRKSWQKEREQLEAVIGQWKQVVERASPERREEKAGVTRELKRQLEAGGVEDANRQVELELLEKKLRALERASP